MGASSNNKETNIKKLDKDDTQNGQENENVIENCMSDNQNQLKLNDDDIKKIEVDEQVSSKGFETKGVSTPLSDKNIEDEPSKNIRELEKEFYNTLQKRIKGKEFGKFFTKEYKHGSSQNINAGSNNNHKNHSTNIVSGSFDKVSNSYKSHTLINNLISDSTTKYYKFLGRRLKSQPKEDTYQKSDRHFFINKSDLKLINSIDESQRAKNQSNIVQRKPRISNLSSNYYSNKHDEVLKSQFLSKKSSNKYGQNDNHNGYKTLPSETNCYELSNICNDKVLKTHGNHQTTKKSPENGLKMPLLDKYHLNSFHLTNNFKTTTTKNNMIKEAHKIFDSRCDNDIHDDYQNVESKSQNKIKIREKNKSYVQINHFRKLK